MKRIFKFKGKYYDYKPQRIMFQLRKVGKFKELSTQYAGKYFFGYLYPWNDYSPILLDYIVTDIVEDEEGYEHDEDYYDWDWLVVDGNHYSIIHLKDMKGIKILDKFPREGNDWHGPDQSKCFGWTGRTYEGSQYCDIDILHDY